MRDLHSYRHAYVLRNTAGLDVAPPGVRSSLPQAHRAMRNAVAVALVLDLSADAAEAAILRIEAALLEQDDLAENLDADDSQRLSAPIVPAADVAVLRDLAASVASALDDGVDDEQRPRGARGQRMIEESEWNEVDPVFRIMSDGHVELGSDRMTLTDLRIVLAAAVPTLTFALQSSIDVQVVPDLGWTVAMEYL